MKRVAVTTLGCKVNQFESASFLSAFQQQGCELVPVSAKADIFADIVVVNTCAVTARAGQQSRQLIRKLRRNNPKARLVVTGCYAQMIGDALPELVADTSLVIIGNADKDRLVKVALEQDTPPPIQDIRTARTAQTICSLPVQRFSNRTRAYLRIQDGCNNFCSYCIVPFTRGQSRSLPLAEVLEQVVVFVQEGYQELVITGINVGKYGLDLAEGQDIYSLLEMLCAGFPSLRIRLSSVEPTEVNERLLELMTGCSNFMPHLHIPLQSGDDAVLARMQRRYRTATFTDVIQRVHAALPHAALGCDILAGFPGEDEQAAERSYRLLAESPLTYLHVFPYSLRPGTAAADFPDHLPGPSKEARVARLRTLDQAKRNAFYQQQCDTEQKVLFEGVDKQTGLLKGFSANYIPVQCKGAAQLVGSVVPVRLLKVQEQGSVLGRVI